MKSCLSELWRMKREGCVKATKPLHRGHYRLCTYSLTNSLRGRLALAFHQKQKGSLSRPTPCSCQSLRSSKPLNQMTFPHSCTRLTGAVATLHFLPQSPLVTTSGTSVEVRATKTRNFVVSNLLEECSRVYATSTESVMVFSLLFQGIGHEEEN